MNINAVTIMLATASPTADINRLRVMTAHNEETINAIRSIKIKVTSTPYVLK